MKITVQPTDQVAVVEGVRVRLYRGHTARGTPVVLYALALLPGQDGDMPAFLSELIASVAIRRPEVVAADPRVGGGNC